MENPAPYRKLKVSLMRVLAFVVALSRTLESVGNPASRFAPRASCFVSQAVGNAEA